MTNPTVSVVIPSYNYGRFVVEAVESVLSQTYRDVEVIVVDDGSTDDTASRLAPYQDRIRSIVQANAGESAARNTGIRAARGSWVAFLDADDLWHPRKLELQMAYLADHPEVDLLATGHIMDRERAFPALGADAARAARSVTAEQLVMQSHFGTCGVVVRKAVLDAVGPFDTQLRYGPDRDMWLRIAGRFVIHRLDAVLWWYRWHDGSASTRATAMTENHRRLLTRAFATIPALQRRPLLRMKALSRAAYAEAFVHDEAGAPKAALASLARAFLLWPLPYRRADVKTSFARPKTLGSILRRALREQ